MVERPLRGEVYWVRLDPVVGSEQGGTRPALVVQNDVGNERAPTTIVAPITSRLPAREYPFQVRLPADLLGRPCVVSCSQVRTITKARLSPERLAVLPPGLMSQVDRALVVALGLG
jgi:mRNA interferase MazF